MHALGWLIFLSGAYPLARAWRKLGRTSLCHALVWASLAWLTWGLVLAPAPLGSSGSIGRYLGLCLIGCAGMAVLGARRPGVGAWNFVVGGLLAVLLLSWAEGLVTGTDVQLGGIRSVFLAATLGVGILNYLPTRLASAVILLAIGCGLELWKLVETAAPSSDLPLTGMIFGLVPWAAWMALRWQTSPQSDFDRLWREFRDSYGLVWGQRLREQFNRSGAHSAWPVELRWHGLEWLTEDARADQNLQAACLETLRALLKRFGVWTAS